MQKMENNLFCVKTKELVALRKKHRFTQDEMGAKLNKHGSDYGKIERGEIGISWEMAYNIANMLKCKLEDIVHLPVNYNKVTNSTFTSSSVSGNVTNNNDPEIMSKAMALLEKAIELITGK